MINKLSPEIIAQRKYLTGKLLGEKITNSEAQHLYSILEFENNLASEQKDPMIEFTINYLQGLTIESIEDNSVNSSHNKKSSTYVSNKKYGKMTSQSLTRDLVRNNFMIPAIASVMIIIVLGGVLYPQYIEEQKIQKEIKLMYTHAKILLNQDKAVDTIPVYGRIIELDESEEDAWHGKGIRLNQLKMCDEAIDHYEKYVIVFPNSEKAKEGYEIAKTC